MELRRLLFLFIIFSPVVKVFGQCPIINFTRRDTVCQNENINIQNNTANDGEFEWDFCAGDFNTTPVLDSTLVISGNLALELFITSDSSSIYGFYTNNNSNELYRLDFGSDINNIPVETNLGNPGTLLNSPYGIQVAFDGTNWVGFVINYSGNNIIRLNFGNSLENSPEAEDLNISGLLNPVGLQLIRQNNNFYLLAGNSGDNKIHIINLGNKLTSNPGAGDIFVTSNLSTKGINALWNLNMIKDCDTWYGLATTPGTNGLFLLKFDNGIQADPSVTYLGNFAQTGYADLVEDGGNYFGFIITNEGKFYKISFGNSLDNPSPVISQELSFTGNSNTLALFFYKSSSNWKGFTFNNATHELYTFSYNNPCHASVPVSNQESPEFVSYDSPGKYYITLTATDQDGNQNTKLDSIIVNDLMAPTIDFNTNNNWCIDNPTEFSGLSSNDDSVDYWYWNLGDGADSIPGQNISHQYSTEGNYKVTLSLISHNGCMNNTSGKIYNFDSPHPDFSLSSLIYCTHDTISFENSTQTNVPDSIMNYTWNFNDEIISHARDTIFLFDQEGMKNITLTAAIPGCSNDTSTSFNVISGPQSDFVFNNVCNKTIVDFTNTTVGDFTASSWDFGDGYTSSLPDPEHLYDSAGTYPIKLTVTNSSGCQNLKYDTLTVYHNPLAGYQYDLPCVNMPVVFYDTSMVIGANIAVYNWSISSVGNTMVYDTSSVENPSFVINQPGDYQVRLISESNFGCIDSVAHIVTFLPGPKADFTFHNICLGDSTYLEDASTAGDSLSINSWNWEINNSNFNEADQSFLFDSAGIYPVDLIVKANNLCTNKIEKEITIHPRPIAGIIVKNNCLNQTSILTDNSTAGKDSITNYGWQFNDGSSFNGFEISRRFDSAGTYSVNHWVISSSQCRDTIYNTITIHKMPHAEFSMIPPLGSPPLDVTFKNQSTGADLYSWNLGGPDLLSSATNPRYTYNTTGDFTVTLLAQNEFGCEDSTSKILTLKSPYNDIALKKVNAFESNGALRFLLSISNEGTTIVNQMNINIIINNEYTLSEPFEDTLYAGDTVQHLLNFELQNSASQTPAYICFNINPDFMGEKDSNPTNNTECYTPADHFIMIQPSPNPANDNLKVSFILMKESDITLRLISSSGNIVMVKYLLNCKSGYNEFVLNLSAFNPGLYFLNLEGEEIHSTKKIILVK